MCNQLRNLIIAVALAGLIIMGCFGMKRKEAAEPIYRLVWFELQIAPDSFRFAILPEQPILIGYEGENGEKGVIMLIRYDHVPDVYERTVEKVDHLVKKCGIMELPSTKPEMAFADAGVDKPSVHVRLAYADGTRWASFLALDGVPDPVADLIRDTKELARQIAREQTSDVIDGDTAISYLSPEKNTAQKSAPSVLVKVKVLLSGEIVANGEKVTLEELCTLLDDLKRKNGGVWYWRESPRQEPPESLVPTIEGVMDAIASRRLPVRLQPEEY